MAIRAAYGFESGLIPSTFLFTGTSTNTADTSIVRNGTYSLKMTNASSSSGVTFPPITLAAADTELIVGFGFYTTVQTALLSIEAGLSANINFVNDGSGNISAYSASDPGSTATGTLLGSFAGGMVVDTWTYFVIRVKFHDTTGIVEVWKDGVQVLNLTGIDTISSGTATTIRNVFGYRPTGNSTIYFDDMVFVDNVGTDLTTVFDPVKIEALRPTSDVAENWTKSTGVDSFALVDEHPVSATDYISSTVATTKEEWGMGDRTHTGPILALVASAVAANLDGGAASLKLGLKRGGAESQSAGLGLAATTTHVQHVVENDPTTGVAWTDANANAVTMTAEVA